MTVQPTHLPPIFKRLARDQGFDPHSDFVTSKAGAPIRTDLTPGEFEEQSKIAFEDAYEVIKSGVKLADY